MKRNITWAACLSATALLLFSCGKTPAELSLAGSWRFALDPEDVGMAQEWQHRTLEDELRLPGSLQEQGRGNEIGMETQWTGQIVDSAWYKVPEYAEYRRPGNIKVPFWLNPDKHYVGAAWYQKTIRIPAGWGERTVILKLERPHWQTTLYLDGEPIGTQNALQTPHRYVLNGLAAGEHTLTLRVDNRLGVDVGINAHSVSDHTQSNWNGIVGEISLEARPAAYVESMRIDPDIRTKPARVAVSLAGRTDTASELILQAETADGTPVSEAVTVKINPGDTTAAATIVLGEKAELW